VAAFMPVAGLCLFPAALVVRLTAGVPLWAAYGLWCASAVGYGLRPVQRAMARLLWPIRRPTLHERRRLEQVWDRVIAHAGVSGRRFRLLVVELPEVNAHSIGRDLICVTTGALAELGDCELAGVLAHELGHHLRMHTSASAFLVWVLLPLQGVALVGNLLAAPAAVLASRLGARWPDHRLARSLARAASRLGEGIRAVFAAPGVAAFAAKNAAGRSAEYRVDAFAVEVGLGAELLSALRWFAAGEKAAEKAAAGKAPGKTPGKGADKTPHKIINRAPHKVPNKKPEKQNSPSDGASGSADPVRGGRARHAAARIRRPTHPPLECRMARIAARVEVQAATPQPARRQEAAPANAAPTELTPTELTPAELTPVDVPRIEVAHAEA
jgi:Zn-dependent protease with chaperone function